MQLSNTEAVPVLMALIQAGQLDIVHAQIQHMAKLADAFGQDVEIVVLPHDELTGQFQIVVVNSNTGDLILQMEPLTREEAWLRAEELNLQLPSAAVVFV